MDKSFIVAKENGDNIHLTPVSPIGNNISLLNIKRDIYSNGYIGYMEYIPKGMDDQVFRYVLMMRNKEERKTYIENLVKRYMPNALLDTIKINGLEREGNNLKITIYFHSNIKSDSILPITPIVRDNAFIEWNDMFVGYAFTTITL
jgi:hypothetical protein